MSRTHAIIIKACFYVAVLAVLAAATQAHTRTPSLTIRHASTSAREADRPVFIVAPGHVVTLASECFANEPHVRTLHGRPFHFAWNADHDRLVFRLHPHGARVVFDGIAFHNHTHRPVRVAVRCGT